MHAKSWCLDDEVYVCGSYNFTQNAEVANGEHLVVARDSSAVITHRTWFFKMWEKVSPLHREEIVQRGQS